MKESEYINKTAAQSASIGSAMGVSREATWNERGIEQQAEALREQVIYLTERLAKLSELMYDLHRHEHNASGKIVVELGGGDGNLPNRAPFVPYALRKDIRG